MGGSRGLTPSDAGKWGTAGPNSQRAERPRPSNPFIACFSIIIQEKDFSRLLPQKTLYAARLLLYTSIHINVCIYKYAYVCVCVLVCLLSIVFCTLLIKMGVYDFSLLLGFMPVIYETCFHVL